MTSDRLSLAIEAAGFARFARIAVLRPRGGVDFSGLERGALHLIQGFKPEHDAYARAGYTVALAPEGAYEAAIVVLPRAKAEARDLIAQAAAMGGPVIVDGQKTDGVDSLLKAVKRAGSEIGPVISKSHGKAFVFTGGDFAEWLAQPQRTPEGFATRVGVFSADGVDRASALLGAALPGKLGARVVDLGAGWGYLSAQALSRAGVEENTLVEAEHAALDCARQNVTDPRARFLWEDVRSWRPKAQFDTAIMNPPFHQGRAAEPDLGRAFIQTAAAVLAQNGQLWMVANRQLPYEGALREAFREVEEIGRDPAFKILHAAKPFRARR